MNNSQVDNAKDLDVVIPVYNLIEYSDNYFATSGSLQQYYSDKPHAAIVNSEPSKSKIKLTGKTPNDSNRKNVTIAVLLKYLSKFWRTIEVPLISYEINLILTFDIKNTILYIPIKTLLTQDNGKLLQQLKSGFRRTINWNKYQSKVSMEGQNKQSDYLLNLSFQGVNRFLCYHLRIVQMEQRTAHT